MIRVEGLSAALPQGQALRDVSLSVARGERLGLVGESGSGKSMLGLALMGMVPDAAQLSGRIALDGQDMTGATEAAWQPLRARKVAMIFQEPMTALDPLVRIGETVMEPLILHLKMRRRDARARALDLLAETGLTEPEAKMRQYPHQLSGGQRQRVLIALALACDPGVLIADEPTTALDAQIALRITDLLVRLSRDRGMALIFISHDLAAVARATERLAVMYGGDLVETGATAEVLANPRHPYTQGLIAARPRPDPAMIRKRLPVIPGTVPTLGDLPRGCRFAGRCAAELPRCAGTRPAPWPTASGQAACHLLEPAP
ncbi:ABC transporter ATP-binding protein [Pseudoroseicyclus aestuarii]|uniref:Peptide/nickel transport system ATP-binding protein n=1 Tax=Pseudoroseicyclus aestuarii TaxID=1795041 RepID=A0A318SWX2_9RHOB|nr:ABC transporter ATP-binding protein [Pseudoroseicyclus aestuarii]PYE84886.1 peptide/nickel transport system ATP-binding protein [Pseudoroseicyclus aestuarii]